MNKRQQKGFTLVELMVVVVIVAIFAAIAIPSYQQYIRRSSAAAAKQEILRLAEQLDRYKSKNFSYHGFDPYYLYNVTSGVTSFSFPTDSNATVRYTITLADISSTTTTTLLSSSAGVGQAWAIKAIPVNTNYDALLMTSTGIQCAVKYTISSDLTTVAAYTGCGTSSKTW